MVYPPKVPANAKLDGVFATMNNTPFLTLPGTQKNGKIQNIEGYATDDIVSYALVRCSDFDPNEWVIGFGPTGAVQTI